jgi:protein gp37
MSTKIEWCDETWSPVTGCKSDFACWDHCWAKRMALRLAGRYGYDKTNPFRPTLHPDKLDQPLYWKKPRTIFVCSMGDLLCDGVPNEWIAQVLNTICDGRCEQHTFVLLTKRPERWAAWNRWMLQQPIRQYAMMMATEGHVSNLVLGTSVSTQADWDARVPVLCRIPAWRRVVSVEPMLGPVDIGALLGGVDAEAAWLAHRQMTGHVREELLDDDERKIGQSCMTCDWLAFDRQIHGVICGSESGHGRRPMDEDWVRSLRDQCVAAGVSFYYKQNFVNGTKVGLPMLDGKTHDELAWTGKGANV